MLYLFDVRDGMLYVCRCRLEKGKVIEECASLPTSHKIVKRLRKLEINEQQQALKLLYYEL